MICGQKLWNTFGPQTWKEIANHHHIGWLQPWKWFFGNLLAISPKSTKEVRKPLGHRGSLCANRQLPCQITMSRQQVSICVFFLFWFAAKDLLYFSNILVAFILWWWEYLNKPFHPSLPGLLGEIDKSRSFLIQGRLSTKKYECMFSLVMHKT